MNHEAVNAAAAAYVAAGGTHEVPHVFLSMFRQAVGEVIDAANTPAPADPPPEVFDEISDAPDEAKPKKAAKPKK